MTNRTIVHFILFLLFSSIFGFAQASPIDWSNPVFTEDYVEGELLIGFKGDIIPASAMVLHHQVGAQVLKQFDIVPLSHVRIPRRASMAQIARQYEAHPAVAYVEPNYIVRPFPTFPNDPDYQSDKLWGVDRIRAPEAWSITTGSKDIVVGVIDSGIYIQHEDLAANIAPGGYDFVRNTSELTDASGHGTHVAGTIGAVGNNGIGVVGVNWNVSLIGLKFLNGSGTTANAIRAVEYAATNTALNIRITNNSWGGGGYSQGLFNAIKRAGEEFGQLFVAAAGNSSNDNDTNPSYPASYKLPNIISVAALAENGSLASFSNFGNESVHLAAPGVSILSTVPGGLRGNYDRFSGTSMAAPHVAGAAALLWSLNPDASYQDIRDALLENVAANSSLDGLVITGGELDVFAAISALRPSVSLDRRAYQSNAEVQITVLDPTLAEPFPAVIEVELRIFDSNRNLRYEMTDFALDRSEGRRYQGAFDLQSEPLPVVPFHRDTLQVSYTDSQGETVVVEVPIDDEPPVLSEVSVVAVGDDSATLRWVTDEPADSRYILSMDPIPGDGLAVLPEVPAGAFVVTPGVVTNVIGGVTNVVTQYVHVVNLSLPMPATRYFVAVLSEDYAGNKASEPTNLTDGNPDHYLVINTLHRRQAYFDDMDQGATGWNVTNLGSTVCWEYGLPTFGPSGAHTGERVWGTVLDGNYPHLAKAGLISEAVDVKLLPRLTFWTWHDLRGPESTDLQGDFGQVQVSVGTGWQNVTSFAAQYGNKVEGRSDGWQQVTINLPPAFENKTIRVRFQFESDESLTAAGWYIDDVRITHVQPPGINVIGYRIDDMPPDGDDDGFPEPGETFYLNLEIYNSTENQAFSNITASVTIPAPLATLTPSTAEVTYGTLIPGAKAWSGTQLLVSVAADIDFEEIGTEFTVFHSAQASGGLGPFVDSVTIPIVERFSVSGSVKAFSDDSPISGAVVRGIAEGYEPIETTTDGSGFYMLHGLVPGVTYELIALKPGLYSPSAPVEVREPAASQDFQLGTAYANPDPDFFAITVDEAGFAEAMFTLRNRHPDTDLPGELNLDFEIRVEYQAHPSMIQTPAWITGSPLQGVVEPGDDLAIDLQFNGAHLNASVEPYRAMIRVRSNDVGGEEIIIPVTFTTKPSPVLFVQSVQIVGGDGDPFPEPGETLELEILLGNEGSLTAFDLEGELFYGGDPSAVTIDQEFAYWAYVWSDSVQETDTQRPEVTLNESLSDGQVLPFRLVVVDELGDISELSFALTVTVRRTISGLIYDGLSPFDPVPGVLVRATGQHGQFDTVTNTDGEYALFGLVDGDYNVTLLPPVGYGAPPITRQTISGADETLDIGLFPWAITANPASIDRTVSEGEEVEVVLHLENAGFYDGLVALEIELVSGIPQRNIGEPLIPMVLWHELTPENHVAGELLVRFEEDIPIQAQQTALATVGAQVLHRFASVPAALIRVPGNLSLQWTAETLSADAAIRYVEPNYLQQPLVSPNDPLFDKLYALQNLRQTGGSLGADIRAVEAWQISAGSPDVVVAVIDSGVDFRHRDLAPNLLPGRDFGNTDPDKLNDLPDYPGRGASHGTHVAGTIAAAGNNARGVIGVAWQASILPLKASTNISIFGLPEVRLPNSATIAALEYAVANDVKISNNSYGGPLFSGVSYEAIQQAMASDHLFIAAAGNDGLNADLIPMYPAAYNLDNIISVAATDHNGLIAPFSNFGSRSVDIAAPGAGILSSIIREVSGEPLEFYEKANGTSMAAPHVAGVAALLKSIAPHATYEMLRDAILLSVRHDPVLEGVVATSGHLDAVAALERIQAFWLQLSVTESSLTNGATLPVTVTLNAGGQLPTGTYEANIVVRGGANSLVVPVTLSVMPGPNPVITRLRVDDLAHGDGDGVAEPGEIVDLYITIQNTGSGLYLNPTGVLSSTNANVHIDRANWPGMTSADQQENTIPFSVTMPHVPGDVDFELTMNHPALGPWVLPFSIPVEPRHSITGTVRDAQTEAGIAGIKVEYWGESGGETYTDNHGHYRIDGLTDGVYRVRAIGVHHEKSSPTTNVVGMGDVGSHFTLRRPEVRFADAQLHLAAQRRGDTEAELGITNDSTDAFVFNVMVSKPRRIALISDRDDLAPLQPLLQELGWKVTLWTNNLVTVDEVLTGRHTTDEATVLTQDLIILDLGGRAGTGRLLSAGEEIVLRDYLQQGGKLIFTGANVLSWPDDRRIRDLVGADTLDRAALSGDQAALIAEVPVDPFWVDLKLGDRLGIAPAAYDRATPAVEATAHIEVDGSTKLLRRVTESGGVVYLWGGNRHGDEWNDRGVWLDMLKGLIEAELHQEVDWLTATPVQSSFTDTLALTVKADSAGLKIGTYHAVLRIRGNYPGADVYAVPVSLEVVQPTLRARSTTGVVNWMGDFLAGNGGANAALFQLIDAGPDGVIQPPTADGRPTGDDILLLTYPFNRDHGRIGSGSEWITGLGRFDDLFRHDLIQTALPRSVYVRAWDAATFADSVAYGDSGLYPLDLSANETHDFGTWIVNQVLGYPGVVGSSRDSNGDSVPDGWYIMNGLDPRRPIAPLPASWSLERKAGANGTGSGQFRFPTRLFLISDKVFVLDRQNTRISVWDRETLTHLRNFGSSGTGNGQFQNPHGLGLAPDANRFAVADSGNHRIQVFTFDSNGGITFERAFGSFGSGAGQFNQPRDVAIGPLGRFYVADMNNHRIQVFDSAGVHLLSFGAFGTANGQFKSPQGIAVDENGIIFVADTDNNRIQGFSGSGTYLWRTGVSGTGNGQFNKPIGIQLGLGGRIYVADTSNNRIQVLSATRNHLGSLGGKGAGDTQVNLPHDVAPSLTSAHVYVADTWNHRLLKMETILDGDGNGMDDTWELLNFGMIGIDPHDDPDDDGLSNIGEFRIGTDPNNEDSNNSGRKDAWEIWAGRDPNGIPPFEIVGFGFSPDLYLRWTSRSGEVYRVDSSTNLFVPDAWLPNSTITSQVDGVIGYTNQVETQAGPYYFRAVHVEEEAIPPGEE